MSKRELSATAPSAIIKIIIKAESVAWQSVYKKNHSWYRFASNGLHVFSKGNKVKQNYFT